MSAIQTGGRRTSSATDQEGGPARGDLPLTYACPVRSCISTWLQQFERDVHIIRVHPKTEDAKMARGRNDDRMRTALQHGSRPKTDTTASWGPLGSVLIAAAAADAVGLLPEDYDIEADLFGTEDEEDEVAPPPEEFTRPARRRLLSKTKEAKSGQRAVDTTVSWNPLDLETAAEALVLERRASTEVCTTARPITDLADPRPVVAGATRRQPRVFKPAGRPGHRRYWPRVRGLYAGRALAWSSGVPKTSKRSSTR
jgi:hypothetical protein